MSPTTLPHLPISSSIPGPHIPMLHVFGDRPFHTDGELLSLAFAPDGGLWSVEEPGLLRHWNPTGGQPNDWSLLSELETSWTFSDGARLLASGSDDLSLWDVADGQLLTTREQLSWVTAVAFSPDSKLLATGHDNGTVRLWDTAGLRLVRELLGHDRPISALAFSSNGRRLASAGEDKVIHLWQLPSGQLIGRLTGHTDRIPALAWHPNGHRLYSAGWDTTARVWDADSGEPIILLNSHSAQVTTLAISTDGRLLACADSASSVHVWDTATNRTLHIIKEQVGEVRCLSFSSDGKQLASGGTDRVIHFWTAPDQLEGAAAELGPGGRMPAPRKGKVFCSFPATMNGSNDESIARLALSPDGTRLASTDGDSGLRIWDIASARMVHDDPDSGPLLSLAWSPDRRWIAGGGPRELHVWDAAGGQRQTWREGQPLPTTSLSFRPDSAVLASASAAGFDVWLWDVNTGEPILLIPDAVGSCAVEALAFHPEGRLLAVGGIDWLATSGVDGKVVVWDLVERCLTTSWKGGSRGLAFHPAGRLLASATLVATVRIWDLRRDRLVAELAGHEDLVNSVAYSPDGNWLASGGADRAVRLWDADTGRPLARMELDTQIKALSFAPDNRSLFTANANTSCYQLDVQHMINVGL